MEFLSRNWGWLVLRGVVAIAFGVFTAFQPGITLAALVLVFGMYALVDGVAMIVWATANRQIVPNWGWFVVGGLLGIGAGVVTFRWPQMTAVTLLAVIATWAIMIGVATIIVAIQLRKVIDGEWRLVVTGLLSIALGVALLAKPAAGALAMVLWIGAFAVVAGVMMIALGFQLRSLGSTQSRRVAPHAA